jgi:hypothetical protein
MNCILHIGAGKAGSSSIQKFLTDNRDELLKNKLLYPLDYLPNGKVGGDNHKSLAFISKVNNWNKPYLKRYGVKNLNDFNRFSDQVIEHYKHEVLNNNVNEIIFSGEQFWSELITEEDVFKLKENFYKIGINVSKIVFYVREQVNWSNSFLHQKLREGSLRSVEFDMDFDYLHSRLNYFDTMNLWSQVFAESKVIVSKFEKGSFYNSDLIKDFIHKVNVEDYIDDSMIEDYNSKSNLSNTSTYSVEQCQAVAFFNKKLETTRLYKPGTLYGKNFSELIKSNRLDDKGFLIPKDKVHAIESLFNYSNKLLFDLYLPDEKSGFITPSNKLYLENNILDFNEKQFYEYLLKIMNEN